MSEKAVEIKLGNVVYQVEREFVGTVSREELLISRLVENKTTSPSQRTVSTIEKVRSELLNANK